MPISYDKETREKAKKDGRVLGSIEVAGLNFQGGVTIEEQRELVALQQKISARAHKEILEADE